MKDLETRASRARQEKQAFLRELSPCEYCEEVARVARWLEAEGYGWRNQDIGLCRDCDSGVADSLLSFAALSVPPPSLYYY